MNDEPRGGRVLGGALILETMFNWPGMGILFLDSWQFVGEKKESNADQAV